VDQLASWPRVRCASSASREYSEALVGLDLAGVLEMLDGEVMEDRRGLASERDHRDMLDPAGSRGWRLLRIRVITATVSVLVNHRDHRDVARDHGAARSGDGDQRLGIARDLVIAARRPQAVAGRIDESRTTATRSARRVHRASRDRPPARLACKREPPDMTIDRSGELGRSRDRHRIDRAHAGGHHRYRGAAAAWATCGGTTGCDAATGGAGWAADGATAGCSMAACAGCGCGAYAG